VGSYSGRSSHSQHHNTDRARFRRVSGWLITCALASWPISVQARGLRAAIFKFELLDTSIEGETNGPRADETARLVRLGQQLRTLVTKSGKLEVVDVAPVEDKARKANLQKCGGCDADLAEKLRAKISITPPIARPA
jgi:hypothetical protein